mmetsp:Transcript_49340/g.97218  ORF Transcript_49340/g.97218 Transcript_49340/m.97218 type:complete len:93 (-) Transcript_49340:100-378(-)
MSACSLAPMRGNVWPLFFSPEEIRVESGRLVETSNFCLEAAALAVAIQRYTAEMHWGEREGERGKTRLGVTGSGMRRLGILHLHQVRALKDK